MNKSLGTKADGDAKSIDDLALWNSFNPIEQDDTDFLEELPSSLGDGSFWVQRKPGAE